MQVSDFCITQELSIRQAIERLDQTAKKVLLVLREGKLIGVITDGDIRRWILKNGDLTEPVAKIMNTKPIVLREEHKYQSEGLMKKYGIEAIPIVNESNEVIDLLLWNQLHQQLCHYSETAHTPVVIMAGGKGSRLYPYTKIIPKPLIPIGDVPIVERIINQFVDYHFNDFYLTVNYKASIIKAYFNQELPYKLTVVEENAPLGTAGSLKLLKETLTQTFFVSNCDILIEGNYSHILKYHKEHGYKITIVTVLKNYVIPYGVIALDMEGDVNSLSEKPQYEFLVSAGMYVIETEVLNMIEDGVYLDMTTLIEKCLAQGIKIGTYPVTASAWLDMGEFKEMQNMIERIK